MSSGTNIRRPHLVALRLAPSERDMLQTAAVSAGLSVSEYARLRLLDVEPLPRRARGRHPVQDHESLARVLSALGRSSYAASLGQLAQAARIGGLDLTTEDRLLLQQTCADISLIRTHLIRALGLGNSS